MIKKPVNWNTLILTAGFAILGFLGKELYQEVRQTHDAVILLRAQMVPRSDFDVQVSDIRTRLGQVEIEIQKLKDQR